MKPKAKYDPDLRQAIVIADDVATIKRELKSRGTSSPAMRIIKRLEDTFDAYEPNMVEKADEEWGKDGEIEIDPGAVCSRAQGNEDGGCYVQAWVWVYD